MEGTSADADSTYDWGYINMQNAYKARVELLSASLDGSSEEPFALVSSAFTENFPK